MTDFLLADDHSEIDRLQSELFTALDAGDVETAFHQLDLFWARLAMHIRAEHLHLFPAVLGAIEAKENAAETNGAPSLKTAQNIIERLRNDHNFFMRELTEAIKQMREMRETDSHDAPQRFSAVREKIAAVSRRLEAHNQAEESEVYQWVKTLFDPVRQAKLSAGMQKEIGNLPSRFCQ